MITCTRTNADNPRGFSALGLAIKVTVTLVLLVSYLSHKVADTLVLSLLFSLGLAMIDGSARQGNGSMFESSCKTAHSARRADYTAGRIARSTIAEREF